MTEIRGQEKPSLEEILEHHGVKGQKWGVRKRDDGSSKSVSPEVKIKREAAAQKHESNAKNIQGRIDKLKAKPVSRFKQRSVNDQIKQLEKLRDIEKKNAENKRQGKLTEQQKTVIKGAAIAVGILAAYGAYTTLNSGQARVTIAQGKAFLNKQGVSTWATNPLLARKGLSPDEIMAHVVKDVNPGYGGIGTKVNCRRCTFAYEMRRRGYDVAATKTTNGSGQTAQGLFNATKSAAEIANPSSRAAFQVSSSGVAEATQFGKVLAHPLGQNAITENINDGHMGAAIFRTLSQHPEGARGELGVSWFGGGAHSVAWEIIGGKPVVFDCQSGKKYDDPLTLFETAAHNTALINAAAFTRLDTLPLNDAFLRRWLKNA